MDMELGIGTEELLVGSCNNNNSNDASSSHIAKGKRTKRLRPLSPCAVTAAAAITSSSSSASGEHGGGDEYGMSFSSTTTTTTFEEEEEDMANCLILLAQGKRRGEGEEDNNKMREKSSSSSNNRRFPEAAATATATTKIGFYIYECKTCNRTFPSFQALGGHRASHKKPKATPEEKKPQPRPQLQQQSPALPLITNCEFEEAKQAHVITSPPISLQLGCGASNNNNRGFHGGNNKPKIHECAICGSEFTTGQALGGHMRRHRTSTSTTAQVVAIETSCDGAAAATVKVKRRNVLELDLNLPAPEDDLRDSKFQFAATQKSMVLSATTALVGCHY